MLRHHDDIEARFLGQHSMPDDVFGLELLMSAEVGEASHGTSSLSLTLGMEPFV